MTHRNPNMAQVPAVYSSYEKNVEMLTVPEDINMQV